MIRVLGLGNDLLADDRFGLVVAGELRQLLPDEVQVVCLSAAGLSLLDAIVGASHLLVVDTWQSAGGAPGTLFEADQQTLPSSPGPSLHYVGLFESMALARRLGMPVPSEVAILAVEPADCITVGGPMTEPVAAAIPKAVARGLAIVEAWRTEAAG